MRKELTRGRELRAYALAEKAMKMYPGKVDYSRVLAGAREYYRNVPFLNYILGTRENHLAMDLAQKCMIK